MAIKKTTARPAEILGSKMAEKSTKKAAMVLRVASVFRFMVGPRGLPAGCGVVAIDEA